MNAMDHWMMIEAGLQGTKLPPFSLPALGPYDESRNG
jgi:hypothetical protein